MNLSTPMLWALLFMLSACTDSAFTSSGNPGRAATKTDADDGDDVEESGREDDDEDDDDDDRDDDRDDDEDDGDNDGSDEDLDLGRDGGLDADDDEDVATDEDLAALPGVEVTKVGVNFEDAPNGDNDKNDAVLCFAGKFKVDSSKGDVTSMIKQTIVATTFSGSGCKHDVRVEVHHADGTKEEPITFRSNSGQSVTLKFKKKSKLEVFMKTVEGGCPKVEFDMHNTTMCEVAADVCRNSGG